MEVGRTKNQGLYNKPSDAVHPGTLAAGTLPQYNTIPRTKHDGRTVAPYFINIIIIIIVDFAAEMQASCTEYYVVC